MPGQLYCHPGGGRGHGDTDWFLQLRLKVVKKKTGLVAKRNTCFLEQAMMPFQLLTPWQCVSLCLCHTSPSLLKWFIQSTSRHGPACSLPSSKPGEMLETQQGHRLLGNQRVTALSKGAGRMREGNSPFWKAVGPWALLRSRYLPKDMGLDRLFDSLLPQQHLNLLAT